jgi:hypothetical protein
MMRDLGVIDAQGELTQSAISAAQEMQTRIANPRLREILPNHGLNIDDWRKVYLDQFNGVQFQTGAGHRFELHFYRDLADQIYIDDDFHIVFQDWFH